MQLFRRFQADLGMAEIRMYAQKLDNIYAIRLSKSWISHMVNRYPHAYYDDALEIIKMLDEIMDEEEFRTYIHD